MNKIIKYIKKPKQFNKIKKITDILSKIVPCLRVNFYKIYLGELTFYHFAGFTKITPYNYEGSYLNIEEKNNEK